MHTSKVIDTACLVSVLRAAVHHPRASPRPTLPVIRVFPREQPVMPTLTERVCRSVDRAICHVVNSKSADNRQYTRLCRARSYLASRSKRCQSRSNDRDTDLTALLPLRAPVTVSAVVWGGK